MSDSDSSLCLYYISEYEKNGRLFFIIFDACLNLEKKNNTKSKHLNEIN